MAGDTRTIRRGTRRIITDITILGIIVRIITDTIVHIIARITVTVITIIAIRAGQ